MKNLTETLLYPSQTARWLFQYVLCLILWWHGKVTLPFSSQLLEEMFHWCTAGGRGDVVRLYYGEKYQWGFMAFKCTELKGLGGGQRREVKKKCSKLKREWRWWHQQRYITHAKWNAVHSNSRLPLLHDTDNNSRDLAATAHPLIILHVS